MIKAIFFDIDGTLVSLKTKVYSPSAKRALELLREKGIRLLVATGRSKFEIEGEHLLEGLTFDGILTNNGQDGYDADGSLLFGSPIHPDDAAAVIDWSLTNDVACWVVTARESILSHVNSRVEDAMVEIHTKTPPIGDVRRAAREPVYKIVLFLTPEEMARPMALMPHSRKTQWFDCGFDIIARDGGKGTAVAEICRRYGLAREETMAFGDGQNDIDMLKAAGIGVAMGNAPEEVKAAADYVTEDVDEDGLWKALEHFGLL